MTPQELRNSILQLAIQGKLVEQRPEEGTAEALYREIQREKARLIKAGKLKKEKPLPEIAEDEKPFEIPEGWKWVRLKALGTFSSGKTPTMGESRFWNSGTISWITSKDMKKKYLDRSEMLITEAASREMTVYPKGTILLVVRSGILKRLLPVAILTGESTINQDIKAFSLHMSCITEYVYYILKGMESHILKEYRKQVTTVDSLRFEDFQNMPVPLPPLAEQHRIVAKIEELLPYVDRYEQAWNHLEAFNKRFPDEMKKSILQLAIQGKLVEQRPEEGAAEELYREIQREKARLIKAGKLKKEKPLPEIAEDEKPFEIPEGWRWVRLRALGTFSSGKTPTMGESQFWNGGTVSWITSKDMKKKYLDRSEMLITEVAAREMTIYPKGTILLVVRSGILKRLLPVAILTGESTINQDIKALSLYMPGIAEYVYCVLKGMESYILKEYRKQVTTVDSLRFEDFQNMPIPLPPLAEQKRIVERLDGLLAMCERLDN